MSVLGNWKKPKCTYGECPGIVTHYCKCIGNGVYCCSSHFGMHSLEEGNHLWENFAIPLNPADCKNVVKDVKKKVEALDRLLKHTLDVAASLQKFITKETKTISRLIIQKKNEIEGILEFLQSPIKSIYRQQLTFLITLESSFKPQNMPDLLWSFKNDFKEEFKSTLKHAGVDYDSDAKLPKLEGILPGGFTKSSYCKICFASIREGKSNLISCNAECNLCKNCTQGSSCPICNRSYSQMEKFVMSQIPKGRSIFEDSLLFRPALPREISNFPVPK